MPKAKRKSEFVCSFCDKEFVTERSLLKHTCRTKLRFMDKDTPYCRLAYRAYYRFYEISISARKKKTFDDFIRSRYYSEFIKFGKYIIDNNILEPTNFIDFVIKSSIPIDKWLHSSLYEIYLRDLVKRESADDAAERTISLMCQWANEYGHEYFDFFRLIEPTLFVHYIKLGRISPWVLYNCDSGKELLEKRLNPDQISIIVEWIDPSFWAAKFKVNKEERESLFKFFKEQGL